MSKKKRYRRYEEPKDPLKVASTVFAVLATLVVWVIVIALIVIGIIYKENFWSVGKYFVFSAPSIFVFLVISVLLGKIAEDGDRKYRRTRDTGSKAGTSYGGSYSNSTNEMNQRVFDENNRLFQEQSQRDMDAMNQQMNDFNNQQMNDMNNFNNGNW